VIVPLPKPPYGGLLMSTRANIYVCDRFIQEVPSDAGPGGDLWKLLESLDKARCRECEFVKHIHDHFNDYKDDYSSPKSNSFGNWSYEFMWLPLEPPEDTRCKHGNPYRDWKRWSGRVLVRGIDRRLTWEWGGHSYHQVPGPWMPLNEFAALAALERIE
jgi:hypothetical protein